MVTITTPEHVEITLQPAGPGSRFLAITIDTMLTLAISALIGKFIESLLPNGVATAMLITISFLLTWGWHVYFETRHQGRSPGKRALSLRVVDARGLPVSLHQALVRNVVRAVDLLPILYGVGAISAMVDSSHRRLGDIVADTLVIRETRPLAYARELGGERRYNSLRTPRVLRLIRHRVSLEEREMLLALCLRAGRMEPSSRYDLMEEVAATYRQKLGIEEELISDENFVRDLTAVLFNTREAQGRVLPSPHS